MGAVSINFNRKRIYRSFIFQFSTESSQNFKKTENVVLGNVPYVRLARIRVKASVGGIFIVAFCCIPLCDLAVQRIPIKSDYGNIF